METESDYKKPIDLKKLSMEELIEKRQELRNMFDIQNTSIEELIERGSRIEKKR